MAVPSYQHGNILTKSCDPWQEEITPQETGKKWQCLNSEFKVEDPEKQFMVLRIIYLITLQVFSFMFL